MVRADRLTAWSASLHPLRYKEYFVRTFCAVGIGDERDCGYEIMVSCKWTWWFLFVNTSLQLSSVRIFYHEMRRDIELLAVFS